MEMMLEVMIEVDKVADEVADMVVDMEVDKVADEMTDTVADMVLDMVVEQRLTRWLQVADMVVDMEVDKGQGSGQTTWPIFQFAVSQFQVWSIVIDNVKERDHTCQSESGLAEMTGALCL